MRHTLFAVLLPVLAACHDPGCPEPSTVNVVASSATPDSAVDTVRSAIDTFARWTDGAGVCVDTVYVTDELPEQGAEGMITARGAWVQLTDVGPTTLEERTIHQLCHAADQRLGLSEGAFADEEAFADACTAGPKEAELLAYTVCEQGDPAAHLLLDELFTGSWPQRIREGAWHFDDAVGSVGLGDDGVVVPAGAGAAILDWSLDGGMATPAVRVVEEGRSSAPIPGPTIDPKTGWQLLGGGGEHPVLLLRDAHGSRGVAFDLDAGWTYEVAVPVGLAVDEGVVAGGALWVTGSVDGTYGAWQIDLDSGTAIPWATPKLVERPLASHGRIAMPDDHEVLVYDVEANTWSAWPLPLGLTALEAMPDALGSLSVRWSDADARGLARLAAPMGDVQLDVEACGDPIASVAEGTWVAGNVDASWSAPDRSRAQLDVMRLSFE